MQLSWNQILLAQYDKKVCFAYAQGGKHMETVKSYLQIFLQQHYIIFSYLIKTGYIHLISHGCLRRLLYYQILLYLSSLLIHVQHKHTYLHKYFLFQWGSNKQNISKGSEWRKEVEMHINTRRAQTIVHLSSGKPIFFPFILLPLVAKNFSAPTLLC